MSLLASAFLDASGRLQEALDEAIRMKAREAESSLSERERENGEMDLDLDGVRSVSEDASCMKSFSVTSRQYEIQSFKMVMCERSSLICHSCSA